ncbi:hypothetical protein EV714DRAFT_203234 [Schizophyllum commune]
MSGPPVPPRPYGYSSPPPVPPPPPPPPPSIGRHTSIASPVPTKYDPQLPANVRITFARNFFTSSRRFLFATTTVPSSTSLPPTVLTVPTLIMASTPVGAIFPSSRYSTYPMQEPYICIPPRFQSASPVSIVSTRSAPAPISQVQAVRKPLIHHAHPQMAQTLDDTMRHKSPQPSVMSSGSLNYTPGFAMPSYPPQPYPNQPGPPPPPPQGEWTPWAGVQGHPPPPPQTTSPLSPPAFPTASATMQQNAPLVQSMQNLSFEPQAPRAPQRVTSAIYDAPVPQPRVPSPPRNVVGKDGLLQITMPLPSIPTLLAAMPTVSQPTHDPALQMAFVRDVFILLAQEYPALLQSNSGMITLENDDLQTLLVASVDIINRLAAMQTQPITPPVAEALFHRAMLSASGAFPSLAKHNPRSAFREFEMAAKNGQPKAWFRLGRDYEAFNDESRAKDCFERGARAEDEACLYRLAMAHLLGQLGLPANPSAGVPLLHRSAMLTSLMCPQPAYVYALLLLGEFSQLPQQLPHTAFLPFLPPPTSDSAQVPGGPKAELEYRCQQDAKKMLERSAYVHFPPALYKLGHCYEFANPPNVFPFDPLLSVQYYSLASQKGEVEADMALSKWFLCGSGDVGNAGQGFAKDEALAYTFARKAAQKGLPSAMFALGYYAEVGIGQRGKKDLDEARMWYARAEKAGNADAAERLTALSKPGGGSGLTRQEHDTITENKLVRKRTQAKQRSDAATAQQQQGGGRGQRPPPTAGSSGRIIESVRKNSIPASGYSGGPAPSVASGPSVGTGVGQVFPGSGGYPASPQPSIPTPRPVNSPPSSHASSPQPYNASAPGTPGMPGTPGAQPQYNPGAARFQLTDPGTVPGARKASGAVDTGASEAPKPKPKPGPQTFAEMGFQGARAEDKECHIM